MRRTLASLALVASVLLIGPRAAAAPTTQSCAAMTAGVSKVDCYNTIYPGFKEWLAWHVPHLPPPPPIPCLLRYESGANYQFPVVLLPGQQPNGYYGAGQWLPSTWHDAAVAADWADFADQPAYDAPPSVQDQVMWFWGTHHGWGQWGTHGDCGV